MAIAEIASTDLLKALQDIHTREFSYFVCKKLRAIPVLLWKFLWKVIGTNAQRR
jgi:hypothetical protein